MRLFVKFLVVVGLVLALIGCSVEPKGELHRWMQPNDKVKVLSTIAMIDDLVQQVGGEHVDTMTLVKGDLDPHTYQLVKGDDEKLAVAQVIFFNGLGLEHGPSLRKFLGRSSKAVSLGDFIRQQDPALILKYNGQLDPHIWMDVSLWKRTVPAIVKTLSQVDPEHAEEYRKNGERLMWQLADIHRELEETLAAVPDQKRYLVTSHDAFNYFARAYLASDEEDTQDEWQDRFQAPEGLAPESQLSTADIQFIIRHMKKFGIEVLFPESNVSQDSIRKILDAGTENGMKIQIAQQYLYGDAMGSPGSEGDTYIKMMLHNARTIANYLNGKNQ